MKPSLIGVVSFPFRTFQTLASALLGLVVLWNTPTLLAATNLVATVRAKVRSQSPSWGQVSVGTPTRVETDPDALRVSEAIRQVFGQGLVRALPGAGKGRADLAAAQADAFKLLKAQVGEGLEVHVRPGNQTVSQLRGTVLERTLTGLAKMAEGDRSERTARAFLNRYRALLRLEDPETELKLVSWERSETGGQHLRFAQRFQDLEVWPCGLSVHLDDNGDLITLDGAYAPTPSGVVLQPKVSGAEAQERAKWAVPSGAKGETKDVSLIVYTPLHATPRLAWKLSLVVDFGHAWLLVVDAQDGQIVCRINQCMDVNVTGSGIDLDGQTRTLNVWSADNKFYLADTTKPMYAAGFDPVTNPRGVISVFDAKEIPRDQIQTVYFIDSTDGRTWLPDAVSALVNLSDTYDYYLERHNRNSIDGNGGNVQGVVRVGQYNNASWRGDLKMMFFGDVLPYAGALDVVGHELTHGVTQNSANLIYALQSGALNEAMSDIFGVMVETRVNGQPDWTEGEKLGAVARDFKNPGSVKVFGRPLPSKMSEYIDMENSAGGDYGGVHINSSIINHTFYLLAEGLPGSIGLRDAERIFYRCLTQHLQPQSEFVDARLGCLASAEELFGAGSAQAKKVAEAFDAVEILGAPPTPEPSPVPVVEGPDVTLYVSFNPFSQKDDLGRREAAKGDPISGTPLIDSVKRSRPSVSGDGSFALFVDAINDLCGVDTDDVGTLQCLGYQGLVHSIALSPDSKKFAFVVRDQVTGQPKNEINVSDLVQNTNRTYKLLVPVVDGAPVDNMLYADSMVFTTDSKSLIYDAVTEIRFGAGEPVQRWSIFKLDVATQTTVVLVPPVEGANFGNPYVSRTGNRYITFEGQDVQSGQGSIFVMDLFSGDVGVVGSPGIGVTGYPCFTGDDSAVIYSVADGDAPNTGYSLVKQPLTADRLATSGPSSLWLQDAVLGVIYRRGTFTPTNTAPSITITAPSDQAVFQAPATIEVTAAATGSDSSITKVQFYEDANYLGQAVVRPYKYTWKNVPPGSYRLIARAFDKIGGTSDSPPIKVTVTQEIPAGRPRLSVAPLPNNTIRLTIEGAAGNYIISQSTDLVNWADIYPVTVDASGTGVVDDSGGPAHYTTLFYRARKE